MKNEKFLQAMGGLDEKFISEADRDVNAWLNSMEGEVVVVKEAKKPSPWKIVASAAAATAAVFAAAVITKNMLGLQKPDISASSGGGSNVSLSEQLSDYEITNLNYDNAVITENAPLSGQWKRMSYDIPGINEQSSDRMAKIAEAYGATINKDDIIARMWNGNGVSDGNQLFSKAYMSIYDDRQFTDPEGVPYNSIFCSSDDIYIEIGYPGYGWIELDNRGFINSFFGKEFSTAGVWRPSIYGDRIHYIDPGDEEETVVLNGKTVKVADAVRNAQTYFSENKALFPQMFDTEVRDIMAYTFENGNQGLCISFVYTFDGVTFTSAPSYDFLENRASNVVYPNRFQCGMLTEDTVDWIWFDLFDGATDFTVEDCEATVSCEDALKFVSQELAPDDMFLVREIQLIYAERRTDGGRTSLAEPTWMLVLAEDEKWDSHKTYAYVSATDGSVRIFE